MKKDLIELLRQHGIQPSAHRLAVAEHVLSTDAHPTADQVWKTVRAKFPVISRATVYNTLNCFVEKGLLRALQLSEGRWVFDPKVERHHHLVDEASGRIFDVPWEALEVRKVEALEGFDVSDYQVILRGRRRKGTAKERTP